MDIVASKSKNSPYFFINSLDDTTARVLDRTLSYYPEGYERTNAYIDGKWDGRDCLFKRSRNGSYYFPIGLIDKVRTVIEAMGGQLIVTGIESYQHIHERPTVGLQWASSISLRDYQYDALMKLLSSELGGGVISLPTGSGKTIVALKYILYRNFPFSILVHRKELLDQWVNEIKKHLNIDSGVIGDSEKNMSPIANVCMVQTLQRNHNLIPNSDVIVVDECHIVAAQTIYDVCMHSNSLFRVGLSATPYREDGADLRVWAACGQLMASVGVPDLIDRGYLARPEFRFFRLKPIKKTSKNDFATVYQEGIVANLERNNAIISSAAELANAGRQVYVHVARIDHGTYLANSIQRIIPSTIFLNGKDTKKVRTKVISDFKDGKIRVLVSTLLKEGVDLPSLDAIIYAAGHRSSVMTIQTIGRALRRTETKDNAIIVDFIDSGQRQLAMQSDERFRTYSETYGKYCQLNIINNY